MLRLGNVWLVLACLAVLAGALPARSHAYTGTNGAFLVRLDTPDAAGRYGIRTDLFLMDGSGAIVRQLTDDPAWEYGARLAGDGQTLVFSSDRSGNPEIYTMRIDGSQLRQVTNTGDPQANLYPAISADGRTIAWRRTFRTTGGDQIVESRSRPGARERPITAHGVFDSPEFSPNGRLVSYDSQGDGGIVVTRRHGQHLRLLWGGLGGAARFSPDGKRLAFVNDEGAGGWAIDSVGADGTRERVLFDAPSGYESQPVWSPDGSSIAFVREPRWPDDDASQIVVLRTDGTHPHVVARFDHTVSLLDWQALPTTASTP